MSIFDTPIFSTFDNLELFNSSLFIPEEQRILPGAQAVNIVSNSSLTVDDLPQVPSSDLAPLPPVTINLGQETVSAEMANNIPLPPVFVPSDFSTVKVPDPFPQGDAAQVDDAAEQVTSSIVGLNQTAAQNTTGGVLERFTNIDLGLIGASVVSVISLALFAKLRRS